ncbi:MAG: hypothetical protein D6714_15315, partial [Bacteroidetes bacterium]
MLVGLCKSQRIRLIKHTSDAMNLSCLPIADFGKTFVAVFCALTTFLPNAFSNPYTLTCPPLHTVNLGVCEPNYIMDWNDITWSSDVTIVSTSFTPEQGATVPPGNHTALIVAVDVQGQTSTCSFPLIVHETPHSLICRDTATVSLSMSCKPQVTFETLTLGTPVACPDEIEIVIKDEFGSPVTSGTYVFADVSMLNKPLTYTLTDLMTGFSCFGVFEVVGPTYFVLQCPPNEVIFCNEDFNSAMIGMPDPASCFNDAQINFNHFDQNYNFICPEEKTFEIVRTWVATNPLGETASCTHTITGKRFSLTQVLFPPDYDDVANPGIDCVSGLGPSEAADTSLTGYPTVGGLNIDSEACDMYVTHLDSAFQMCGASYELRRYWTVIDSCTLESRTEKQTIIIHDQTAPVFDVVDTIYTNIGQGCSKTVYFPPIENVDECSDFEVRISTPFDTLHTNGGTMDILFLPGTYFCDYTVTDACGNSGTEPFILVVDVGPLLKCPPNRTVSANYYADNVQDAFMAGDTSALDFFGTAITYVNCPVPYDVEAEVLLNTCGAGQITRTFVSTDPTHPAQCVQTINVRHVSDFVVEFPPDVTIECAGNAPFDAGEPVIHFADWENMDVTFSDQKFDIAPGYCFRILRTWTVANQCISQDTNAVVEASEYELSLNNADCNFYGDTCDIYTFKDGVNALNFPDGDPDGFIQYTQVIRVRDDEPPVLTCSDTVLVEIDANLCNADVVIPPPEYADCTPLEQLNITSDLPGLNLQTLQAFDVPVGEYLIGFEAFDDCGNTGQCTTRVVVADKFPPFVFCKNTTLVSLELVGDSVQATAPASLFTENSFDNCGGDLTYSFSPDPADTLRVYTCEAMFDPNLTETIYGWDASGNVDSCTSNLQFSDLLNLCNPTFGFLSGKVEKPTGVGVSGVQIFLDSTCYAPATTNTNGAWSSEAFEDCPPTDVVPVKDVFPLNGVTTFDLVVLRKHILVIEPFDSPYLWIAADVNNTGTVTTSDAVVIR